MIQFLLSAVPVAIVWVAITGKTSLDSLGLGYIIGLFVIWLMERMDIRFTGVKSVDRIVALVTYVVTILWTSFVSSLHVARMVLRPKIELKTGVIRLNTGDLSESQMLTALSAHGINMTPGEMVIEIADGGDLYVHCIDLEESRPVIEQQQAKRLKLLRRIVGEK
jgi:multisubunit Na+/H+ antiporter MnhE subunit